MINYQNNWILNVYVQLILADSKRGEASETLFMVRTQARIIFASTAVPREIRFVRLLISQMIFIINTSTWYVGSATEWLEAAGLADTQGKTLPFFAVLLIFKYHLSWTVVKFYFLAFMIIFYPGIGGVARAWSATWQPSYWEHTHQVQQFLPIPQWLPIT